MVDMAGPEMPENGNRECVECLEELLARARKGGMAHISFAYVEVPNDYFICGSYGTTAYQEGIQQALEVLRREVDAACEAEVNPYDPNISADHVCYSLNRGIFNFDFLPWMITAEMRRIREGAPAPLKVAFYKHANAQMTERQTTLWTNILIPLATMIAQPSEVLGGYGGFTMFYSEIVEASLRGEAVPQLKSHPDVMAAVAQQLQGLRPITITLREAEHFPHRNSNMEAWIKFAHYLKKQGEQVIFVRDTARAAESLDDNSLSIFPAASFNLHTRLALYKQSKINFGVANGPMTMCFHTDTPFMFFSELDPLHLKRYKPSWPEWWPTHMGIDAGKGEQFPWFNEAQQIVWKRDDFDTLVETYEKQRS